MVTAQVRRVTPEEYLAAERQAESKSEFVGGEIVAMAGASREHNLITGNAFSSIHRQLMDSPCEVYAADMRVRVRETGDYTYPDVVAVCGEPEFEDAGVDTLLNPLVIVEVLSPSTSDYDRGTKFGLYRQIKTLTDYLLIEQDRLRVEHYARRDERTWLFTEHTDSAETIRLASLDCTLSLADIYRKIPLPSS